MTPHDETLDGGSGNAAQAEDAAPGAELATDGIPNLRDVGGYVTADGRRVRRGLVYRSTALDAASDADLRSLRERDIRTVVDLRTASERTSAPDRLPEGAVAVDLDVMADSPGSSPAKLAELAASPEQAVRMLATTDVDAVFDRIYRELVSLPSARASYRALFGALADEASLPALYHCTTGKDRTGWATAALLLLLGVDEPTVIEDYLLSNPYLEGKQEQLLRVFAAHGGDPERLKAMMGVKAEYLQSAIAEARSSYGTIEGYFTDGLGLGPDVQQRLREVFLD